MVPMAPHRLGHRYKIIVMRTSEMHKPVVNGFADMHDVLMERARALRPLLRQNSARHEEIGELTPEVVEAVDRAELFKMAAPRRLGGLSIPAYTMANVFAELAKGCASTAWVVSIVNTNIWLASAASHAVQQKIFANGVPRITGPGFGRGTLVRREDGRYILNGIWGYGSASHHAQWALLYAADEEDRLNRVAVLMSDLRIQNTWRVAGMQGTGSDSVVAKDVVVDADQFDEIKAAGTNSALGGDAYERETTDFWEFPMIRAKAFGFYVGCAEALLEHVIGLKERPVPFSNLTQRGDSAVWQARLGEAAAKIGVARLLMDTHTRFNDDCARARRSMSYEERCALRGENAIATDLLIVAVEKLMDLAGSSAYSLTSPAQRFWRDFSVAMRHGVYNTDLAYEVYGKQLLGVRPNIVLDDII
jgi:alkylation response protein AidB-like acyl-CoA dehydrogenase